MMTDSTAALPGSRWARLRGRDLPAGEVLANALADGSLPIAGIASGPPTPYDYAQIDPALQISNELHRSNDPIPAGASYPGLTPAQRYAYLRWLDHPLQPAPAAFRQLYVATLETWLLQGALEARHELLTLHHSPAWPASAELERTLLLAHWLAQDGADLAAAVAQTNFAPASLGLALGWQALFGHPLQADELARLLSAWNLLPTQPPNAAARLRLASLYAGLDAEPLAWALGQLNADALQPRSWRAVHRDLRFAIPQPNLHPLLLPRLADLLAVADLDETTTAAEENPAANPLRGHIVLEFGHSRSEYFETALLLARRQPSFQTLMDENRQLVYRIHFEKGKARNFWRLWDYVRSWSSACVYVDGRPIERQYVFPYSADFR